MNIKITYNWLLEYLDTDATPDQIREYLSLCGPSVESVTKIGSDYIFDIEITSNRIDTASVIGIAQEAQAILPMFGKKAALKLNPLTEYKFAQIENQVGHGGPTLQVEIKNPNLVSRFTALIFDKIVIGDSPDFIKERLKNVGVKVINNVVDISNYLMLTLGQPIHMFDYDKIAGHKMIVRESKKGEKLVTLDEKEITLPGGDVVIEDGSGKLIDLCGIMGGANSAIGPDTKRVLLFVQTYNKSKIRKTTMTTGQRTIAATFFEKGLDETRVEATLVNGARLLQKYAQGKVVSEIKDIYPKKTEKKKIEMKYEIFDKKIGVKIDHKKINSILSNLDFGVTTCQNKGQTLHITVPTFRTNDIDIPEDIVEEVARVYGYHNIPSVLQPAVYVKQPKDMEDLFVFQNRIKIFLKHLGLNEVINYSMISKSMIEAAGLKMEDHLRLSNSISEDIEFLRISLLPSLSKNIKENQGRREVLKIFEIAKVYIKDSLYKVRPYKDGPSLPQEIYRLGIAVNTDYTDLKGIIEAIQQELNIPVNLCHSRENGNPGIIVSNGNYLFEINLQFLIDNCQLIPTYKPIHPYAVIKLDKTFEVSPQTTYEVIRQKSFKSKLLQKIEAVTLYKNKLTLRFFYSSPDHNITEEEAKTQLVKL